MSDENVLNSFLETIETFREIEFYAREFLKGGNDIAITFKTIIKNTAIALFIEREF
jgi:hypothetical protein